MPAAGRRATDLVPSLTPTIPPLFPIYLLYRTQHQIVTTVQSILEECCYEFAEEHLSEVIATEEWDCPESVELTSWTKILLKNQHLFAPAALTALGRPLKTVLDTAAELRHTAVHRLRTSAKGIERLVRNAEALAKLLLNDSSRTRKIGTIRRELQSGTEELQRNKDLLETRLAEQIESITEKRAELDRLEIRLVRDMVDEDRENQRVVGRALNEVLARVEDRHPDKKSEGSGPVSDSRNVESDLEADLELLITGEAVSD